jgi:clan AA aspartic protease (TIGR02281 family)
MLTLAILSLSINLISAQSKEGNETYRYLKAIEILDKGGNPDEAQKLLSENMKEYPKHIDSYLVAASIHRHNEDYSSALRVINNAMKNNYKNSGISESKLLWWKASIHGDLLNYTEAIPLMVEAVKKGRKQDKENLINMLETLGQLYYESNEYSEADNVYREMLKLSDDSLLPQVGLARNHIAREEYDEALKLLDNCLKYDREYVEIYRFKMQAYEGKKEYKNMIDMMITLYDKTGRPNHISVKKLMHDKKYSFAVIKEKIASEQDNSSWKYILSVLYRRCYQYSNAIQQLDELINEYGFDDELLADRAECFEAMGMTERAIAEIDKALEVCKESDQAFYYGRRSEINRSAGNYEMAITDIEKYIERYPTDAYGYYARGWCKELSGNRAGALEDYNEGIAVDEEYPYIYLMRGTLYMEDGNTEKANQDFKKVIEKDTVVISGTCRHYALHFLGRSAEAIEWMDKLIDLDENDPGSWYDKACLYARMGKLDESVDALRISFEKGNRAFPHIEHDNDMDPIRDREDFKVLIEKYKNIHEDKVGKSGINVQTNDEKVISEIDMKKMYGGTYEVGCSVNGLPLKMIFDTGAADVTISSVEANFMLKNGYLADSDIKGKRSYQTASGDIHEGTVLRLKEVKLGNAVLKNVEASVVHSQKAPLLLGQSVLEKFGTITIDNINSKLVIVQ